jgi:hypothetical protein
VNAVMAVASSVSVGWKWIAVLIGLSLLVLLWVLVGLTTKNWNPLKVVEGADGISSTSKFQWLLWLMVILFAYAVLWVLRAKSGNYGAISNVPVNLLTVLGFSTGTAIAAKGITVGYVSSGQVAKPSGAPAAGGGTGGIFQDDGGTPELAKIQLVGFTLIAISIFLVTLIHQIVSSPVQTILPNIDSSLLVLMGISQGGYLGKKLVTTSTPVLNGLSPSSGRGGTTVTLSGTGFGSAQDGSQILVDGTPQAMAVQSWSDNLIKSAIPAAAPNGSAWVPGAVVQISLIVNGVRAGNSLPFTLS